MHDYLFCVLNNTILYYVIVISILIYLIWFSQNKFHDVGRHVTVNSDFPELIQRGRENLNSGVLVQSRTASNPWEYL